MKSLNSKSYGWLALIVLAVFGLWYYLQPHSCREATVAAPRIAHAGGGVSRMTYTNSLEALNRNATHYDLFELDFVFTQDGQLVCLHDWQASATRTLGQAVSTPPTLAAFEKLVAANPYYKSCTAKTLKAWLKKNPGKRIVTDIKDGNMAGLKFIAANFPGFADRFIPQIYTPQEYALARQLGYKDIIWTLYQFKGDNSEVLEHTKRMKLYGVTMSEKRAKKGLGCKLQKQGIATYVHTINSAEDLRKYRKLGISEIYTDWLKAK